MSEPRAPLMAPHSHRSSPDVPPPDGAPSPPDMAPDTPTPTITSPLPDGILSKGGRVRKRVTFRDSELVNVREIPPRSRCPSSSNESDEDDDDDDSDSSDSDSATDSEEENNVVVNGGSGGGAGGGGGRCGGGSAAATATTKPAATATASTTGVRPRPVNVSRPSGSAAPVSTIGSGEASPVSKVRPERAPIPWSASPSFSPGATAKGSYDVTNSSASRVVALVSQITGVSTAATQAHLRQRTGAGGRASPSLRQSGGSGGRVSPSTRQSGGGPQPRKLASPVSRGERRARRITPTLDGVLSPNAARSPHRQAGGSECRERAASAGSANSGARAARKKRVLHKRQDEARTRKAAAGRKGSKDGAKLGVSGSKVNVSTTTTAVLRKTSTPTVIRAVNGAKDSLSLPSLVGDGDAGNSSTAVGQSARALQQMSLSKTSLYTVDGFIFPGDPSHDLAAGVHAVNGPMDDARPLKPVVPVATSVTSTSAHYVRERVNSAPPGGSCSRRRRYYAWQMANGNLQSTLHESPSITPMWDTLQPAPSRPGHVTDR